MSSSLQERRLTGGHPEAKTRSNMAINLFTYTFLLSPRRNSAPANESGIFGTPIYRNYQPLDNHTLR
jgi:hypothetical protein